VGERAADGDSRLIRGRRSSRREPFELVWFDNDGRVASATRAAPTKRAAGFVADALFSGASLMSHIVDFPA
jgi:hypothetical protein